MKVTYNESLMPPPAGEPRMRPYMYDEKGAKVTAPKGYMFMVEDAVADLSCQAPSEQWEHADIGDAEGLTRTQVWHKSKVLSDIIKHRMEGAPPAQCDQWKAMREFHERYTTSDSVPSLPITMRAGLNVKCLYLE